MCYTENGIEYRTVHIPNWKQYHFIWNLLRDNNYDVIADPEYHELDIFEDQFIEATDIMLENNIDFEILFLKGE